MRANDKIYVSEYLKDLHERVKFEVTYGHLDKRTVIPITCKDLPHPDEKLHCRYSIATEPDAAIFTLQRTREDNTALLREAETMGVTKSVGLWQELSAFP